MSFRVCRSLAIFIALLGLAAGCSKPKTDVANSPKTENASSPSAAATSSPPASNYACTLLTKEEATAVQGEAYKDTKPTEKIGGGLVISQCYFELPTAVNSIVLTVTRKAEGGRDPSDSWREIFHQENEPKKKEEEEEGEGKKPLKVDGVGDEAFWTGTRVGGALFVLKGNAYIRISVGGAGDQAQKIDKSKALAENVLKRL